MEVKLYEILKNPVSSRVVSAEQQPYLRQDNLKLIKIIIIQKKTKEQSLK